MIELMRDEILERLDELYYGPQYPEQIYIIERRWIKIGKSMIELMRDEILERLDELYYGPRYPEEIYIIERRDSYG